MPRKKDKTILIVDEEESDRAAMRLALQAAGYETLEAIGYRDALDAYEQHHGRIHMLVTAIALSGNNGYELARSVFRVDPGLKVLFVSGLTGAEVSRFYNMPVTGPHLIEKPFQTPELVRRVGRAFRSSGARKLLVQSAH